MSPLSPVRPGSPAPEPPVVTPAPLPADRAVTRPTVWRSRHGHEFSLLLQVPLSAVTQRSAQAEMIRVNFRGPDTGSIPNGHLPWEPRVFAQIRIGAPLTNITPGQVMTPQELTDGIRGRLTGAPPGTASLLPERYEGPWDTKQLLLFNLTPGQKQHHQMLVNAGLAPDRPVRPEVSFVNAPSSAGQPSLALVVALQAAARLLPLQRWQVPVDTHQVLAFAAQLLTDVTGDLPAPRAAL